MYQPHFFLGISVPMEIAKIISEWAKLRIDKLPFQAWVVPEDYHITLIFLGAATDDQLAGLSSAVSRITANTAPFSLNVSNLGYFGTKEQPRVFWAGTEASNSLNVLQKKIVEAAVPCGYVPENRPYRPHITIARKWKGEHPIDVPPFPQLPLEAKVNEITLYRSHTNRSPKYEAIRRFSLS